MKVEGMRGYGDMGIQGYRGTGIQGYGDTGIMGYRDTGVRFFVRLLCLTLLCLAYCFS